MQYNEQAGGIHLICRANYMCCEFTERNPLLLMQACERASGATFGIFVVDVFFERVRNKSMD